MKIDLNISIPRLLDLYTRVFVLILCLSLGLAVLLTGARTALAAELRAVAVVRGDSLTVGDIFDRLPAEKAAYILGPAPAPGADMHLDARSLMRIAVALDLPWRPDNSATSITVRRDATLVPAATVESALRDAFSSKGLDGSYEIAYSAGAPVLALRPGLPATLDITALELDRARDTFRASIAAPSADDPQVVTHVSGTLRHKVTVPVLRSTLKNGDIINERDIDMIEIYAREVQPDMMLDVESAVGLTPRRLVAAGKPLRGIDLQAPQLVSRGENVTLVFDSAPLYLTAKGRALQAGGKGDMVRVVNIASNRSIEGIVTASGTVTVAP